MIIGGYQGEFHDISCPLGEGPNNQAETQAAVIGIKWCMENGYTKVHIEADSSLLIHWLTKNSTTPCNLSIDIQKLREKCQQCEIIIYSHVYREGNCPVDSLSKLGHTHLSETLPQPIGSTYPD